MLVHFVAGLMHGFERRSAQLELAARLQRDRTSSIIGQSDRIAVLDDRLPSETRHLPQHRADPVRPLIGDPAQIRAPEHELFVLCANAPCRRRLASGFEVFDKLPLVGDRRSRRTRSGRHPRRNSSGNVAAARLSNRFNRRTGKRGQRVRARRQSPAIA